MQDSADRLKELLAAGAESDLVHTRLEPDGTHQLRPTTVHALSDEVSLGLAKAFADRSPGDFPRLVVAWGKSRVGSTALTKLFGMAGIPAYHEPVKTFARHVLAGGDRPRWALPDGEDVLFANETAGPHAHYETLFDPLRCLLDAGWPRQRLELLVLDRDPVAALNSWLATWAERMDRRRLRDNFELATLNYRRIRARGRNAGVRITHYAYEAGKRPTEAIRRLFERLGVADRYQDAMVTDWGGLGDGYRYRPTGVAALTPEDEELAHRADIQTIYRTSVRKCARDLGLLDLAWRGAPPSTVDSTGDDTV